MLAALRVLGLVLYCGTLGVLLVLVATVERIAGRLGDRILDHVEPLADELGLFDEPAEYRDHD